MYDVMIKSKLAKSADHIMKSVRHHEDRWMARVQEDGLEKFLQEILQKLKEVEAGIEGEHALLEAAAATMFAYDMSRKEK